MECLLQWPACDFGYWVQPRGYQSGPNRYGTNTGDGVKNGLDHFARPRNVTPHALFMYTSGTYAEAPREIGSLKQLTGEPMVDSSLVIVREDALPVDEMASAAVLLRFAF
ncbi:hypothetical protein MPER_00014, partial [Moniliophthora perniciosa FA553]